VLTTTHLGVAQRTEVRQIRSISSASAIAATGSKTHASVSDVERFQTAELYIATIGGKPRHATELSGTGRNREIR
jgi:hypothetical protein